MRSNLEEPVAKEMPEFIELEGNPDESLQAFTERVYPVMREMASPGGKAKTVVLYCNGREAFISYDEIHSYTRTAADVEGMLTAGTLVSLKTSIIANELIVKLQSLDFDNINDVFDWLITFESKVPFHCFDVGSIISVFAAHGFFSGMNCGEAYNAKDPHNRAQYIVGQALQTLETGGVIMQPITGFIKRWRNECSAGDKNQSKGGKNDLAEERKDLRRLLVP
ncbi:MAG: hypothetical protein UR28_C0009G0010 [Candidatus Peregrinibacteria bacterium GW2011_GWF2_33_10]|nr:MAG: hypothetical protein UR28_C0009G0010 [Candidatus Peregrinibacteria bacterium GW2011_GWF2_33_10]OGJ44729.1 MAG: hypothetical protein A2263_02065 [Candidatus Peregrinibacteria bacterium RIFOXYA2_FULL_33_21]OGJ46768.1 MAG: hypothetical protein A2272_02295 [Candidatus Peregrinibacteria bacterium RIFOXYA12_FULL_33_12]OGJ50595.1 MAG: hypothetical protein A2307_00050 [Candidatus Peregrinibacteria bacterium RIFOXYB2_FULL_33_20]